MDVVIETQDGRRMKMEIWFFDKIVDIKKRIQKYHKIPVQRQTLMLDNKVLEDDLDTEHCLILHNTHIKLLVQKLPEEYCSNSDDASKKTVVGAKGRKVKLSSNIKKECVDEV